MSDDADDDDVAGDGAPENDTTNPNACPECGREFESRLKLGIHRKKEHGVLGVNAKRKAETGDGDGASTSRPRGRRSASGRVEERKRLVRESITELTDFANDLRGRSDVGEVDDLADILRGDADRIAGSLAWTAERFAPLGRLIDAAFGHGGLVTIAQGFLGVGRWMIGRARLRAQQIELARVEAEAGAGEYGNDGTGGDDGTAGDVA